MLRATSTAFLVGLAAAALVACSADDADDARADADRGDTAALVVGGDDLPPSDVEEFTSFDAEQLAATCGDSPQLPSQRVCAMPFVQGTSSGPVVIVRATFPEEEAFFAVSADDECVLDTAACAEPVELTPEDVTRIVTLLDLDVAEPLVTPAPAPSPDGSTPTPSPSPTETLPADGAS